MKCSSNHLNYVLNLVLMNLYVLFNLISEKCVECNQYQHANSILIDFDYLVSQLYVQHCTFVEIGEGICSLFVELSACPELGRKRRQMFFGNCLCSEFRSWQLCSHQLALQRPQDCVFAEGTDSPATSARVHRRLCDVTGMSQWNAQCNCSTPLAARQQEPMRGFRTCFANPMPVSICAPRSICGVAHCDLSLHGALYAVRCDKKCKEHQPFCEKRGPATSERRIVTSQWSPWHSLSGDDKSNVQQFQAECFDPKNSSAFDCLGPGLLCCSPGDMDCICEVKLEDGRLKVFRYTITLENKMCSEETNHSAVRVRSAGCGDQIKVWNRFLDLASKEDGSNSLFNSPKKQRKTNKRIHTALNKPEENEVHTSENSVKEQMEKLMNSTQLEVNVGQLSATSFQETDGHLGNITKILRGSNGSSLPNIKNKAKNNLLYQSVNRTYKTLNGSVIQNSKQKSELLNSSKKEKSEFRFSSPPKAKTEETTTVESKHTLKTSFDLQGGVSTVYQTSGEQNKVSNDKQNMADDIMETSTLITGQTLSNENAVHEKVKENKEEIDLFSENQNAIKEENGISKNAANESNLNKMLNLVDTAYKTSVGRSKHQNGTQEKSKNETDFTSLVNKYPKEVTNSNSISELLKNKPLNEVQNRKFKVSSQLTGKDDEFFESAATSNEKINNLSNKLTTNKVVFEDVPDKLQGLTRESMNTISKVQVKTDKDSVKIVEEKKDSQINSKKFNKEVKVDGSLKADSHSITSEDNERKRYNKTHYNHNKQTNKPEKSKWFITEALYFTSDIENLYPKITPTAKLLVNGTKYREKTKFSKQKPHLKLNNVTVDLLKDNFSQAFENITSEQVVTEKLTDAHPSSYEPNYNQSTQISYDEPEPVLKELDKESVDDNTADALNSIMGLGKMSWSKDFSDSNKYFFSGEQNLKPNNESLASSNSTETIKSINN